MWPEVVVEVREVVYNFKPSPLPAEGLEPPLDHPSRSGIPHRQMAVLVSDVRTFFDKTIVIDPNLRFQLDAFEGRNPEEAWAWFVQATRF